ncbi:MAG TPA: biotin/lipoyl-containing protein, partial [Chloroflexota bacterium]|nr:biotin/lipoyl-containing protein [Chloroflexota bacterium]
GPLGAGVDGHLELQRHQMIEKPNWVGTIQELIRGMSSADVTELEIRQGDLRIRLRRKPGDATAAQPTVPMEQGDGESAAYHKVVSPLTGIFYAASDPASPPYVSPGDWVEAETVVGLIETMKVYNEVVAECRGRVMGILVQPGQLVHAGEPILLVDVDAPPDGNGEVTR